MEEVLLGDDVLVRLGIDVRAQLGKKGGTDIDYIEAGEQLKSFPHMGGDCEAKIEMILAEKVQESIKRGLSVQDAEKWTNMLLSHMDEFRTTSAMLLQQVYRR